MVHHTGGCHCGRVRFEVTAPEVLEVEECNCSMCGKSGYLHLIVPADRFRLLGGANARCIDSNTVKRMDVRQFNGREWEQQYPAGRGEYEA